MSTTAQHPNSVRDRSRCGAGTHFTMSHSLRPWGEVARLWNERSGEKPLTSARVWQIGQLAEAKLRKLLAEGGATDVP